MSKIKQTAVNQSGGLSAIVGARPLSPDQVRDLNLHNRMALESLLNGGTQRDYEVISAMSNLVQIIDNNHFYGRKADTIKHAQDVIKSCYELAKNRGAWLLTADGIRQVKILLELHEAQLVQVTQREMRKDVEHAQKLERDAYKKLAKDGRDE